LAGANLIYGAGMIESGVTFDCGQFVIDNELARMIKHTVAGIPVEDDTLAVDDIHAVGPFRDFLSLDSTLQRMREQSQPKLLDRRVREDWEADGGRQIHAVALEQAREIMAEHVPLPVPDESAELMRRIVADADRQYAGA
jgi:trimethylamine--corrinoid protein Co-methyltransferase